MFETTNQIVIPTKRLVLHTQRVFMDSL
jgi:hypothetical protein